MSFNSKIVEDKDSLDFRGHCGILLLLIKAVHCLEK